MSILSLYFTTYYQLSFYILINYHQFDHLSLSTYNQFSMYHILNSMRKIYENSIEMHIQKIIYI